PPAREGTRLYMAGVGEQDGQIVSSGGRVLTVAGEGKTMREARERAYRTISMIGLEGGQFRTDIGAEEMTG
ncbi:MAG: phosphoribosylamine--glycine ligase, partial [Nitrospirae bacterium]|nr:phosphoribosylamine--glycine ligase [Nitrospirota bacterium]